MGQKTKTASTIDPKLMGLYQQNYQHAQGLPGFQSYTGQMTPGIPQATNNAVAGATGIMGYQPQQVSAPMAGAAKAKAAGVAQTPGVTAQTGLGGISQYMNPYEDSVVNAAMSDIDRQRQMSQVGNAQQSTMGGGAFGGSRLGVQEAETNRGYADVAARTAAGLRMGGFNTASGLMQSDYDRALAAQQGNQGVAANRASQVGSQQQGANLANAGYGQQTSLANAQLGMQGQLANQSAGLQGAGLNLNAANSLGQLGQSQFSMGAQGLNAQYQEFLRGQGAPMQQQQQLNQALGLFSGGMGSQQTYQQQSPWASIFGGALGGIGQGIGYNLMNQK